jgi:pyruvate,orthophosphate dikinase
MFFDHVDKFRAMIVAESDAERQSALEQLLPLQRDDFLRMFRVMGGRPLTIRLLDPPLHEFLPQDATGLKRLAEHLGKDPASLVHRAMALKEANPMLGNRGVRLAIVYPDIPRMQTRAIFEAACQAKREGVAPRPEIMIPLAFGRQELDIQACAIREVAEQVLAAQGCAVDYKLGSMIEVPRAALVADEIAQTAEFFSFGTNDLTQTTLGLSRDDSGTFLPLYQQRGIVPRNPSRSVDQDGVGELVRLGTERGRAARPGLSVGICGEHGGDPESIGFFHRAHLDYVCCSPFRLPVARLAAAQAALEDDTIEGRSYMPDPQSDQSAPAIES